MVAPSVLEKLPWKKILQEAAKMAPYVYEKIKEILNERRAIKDKNNGEKLLSVEEKLKFMEGEIKSVENNIVSQADVINKMQDQIGFILSGLNSLRFRQNIVIGLSIFAIIASIASFVVALIK